MPYNNNINDYLTMLPGGTSLPGVTYPLASINGCIIGDNDVYTVPAGRRALVLDPYYWNPTVSTATLRTNWKIGGVYYPLIFTTSLGASAAFNSFGPVGIVMEAGESISVNSNLALVNFWFNIVEFDNKSGLKTAKLTTLISGNNVIYTCPTGKTSTILSDMGTLGSFTSSSLFFTNNSGSTITYSGWAIPNGSSAITNNLFGTSTLTTGTVLTFPFRCDFAPGDNITFASNVATSAALIALTVSEV